MSGDLIGDGAPINVVFGLCDGVELAPATEVHLELRCALVEDALQVPLIDLEKYIGLRSASLASGSAMAPRRNRMPVLAP
jgi:hypothetical protein